MTTAPYHDEPLGDRDRATFSCGVEPLDRYFRQQAGQDQRRRLAVPYVVVERITGAIAGYYTLSSFAARPASFAADLTKRLPPHEVLPAILIGRLAVDRRYHGHGLGRLLLASALRRCLAVSTELSALIVVVDAKDDSARAFYEHAGLLRFLDHDQRLYIPLRSVSRIVNSG